MLPLKPGFEGFRFVSVTDPAQNKDAAQRRAIRKHVMRRFWGQIKAEGQSQEGANSSIPIPIHESVRYLTFRTCSCQRIGFVQNETTAGPCTNCGGAPITSSEDEIVTQDLSHAGALIPAVGNLFERLGAGFRDPFQSFPIPTEPQTEFMLQHWIANLSPSIATLEVTTNRVNQVNPVIRLVQTITRDPAMLHAMIAFSSSLMDARSGKQPPTTTTLFHLGHAIRLLNKALSDPSYAVSDQVCTTICLIAAHNAIFGDFKNHKRHADGLERVIEMRGGMGSLAPDGLLRGMVLWVDQFHGLYSNCPPRHPQPIPESRLIITAIIHSDPSKSSFQCEILSDECVDMMEKIGGLMHIVESCRKVSVSPSDRKAFYNERGWIENRMIHLMAESSVDDSRMYEHCVYLAASLYHHTVPRPLCIWSGVHATIVGKLKRALLRTDLDAFWEPHEELLLWVLMAAAPACTEGSTKLWFFDLIKVLLRSCFPQWNAMEIKDILRKFLWYEIICGPACEGVLRRLR